MDVKELRNKYNLTQQELADKCGVTLRTVQNWERGRTIPDSALILLESLTKHETVSYSGEDSHYTYLLPQTAMGGSLVGFGADGVFQLMLYGVIKLFRARRFADANDCEVFLVISKSVALIPHRQHPQCLVSPIRVTPSGKQRPAYLHHVTSRPYVVGAHDVPIPFTEGESLLNHKKRSQ